EARVAEIADHRPDGESDARRPGAVPAGRRQRLHRETSRCGQAGLPDLRLDGAIKRGGAQDELQRLRDRAALAAGGRVPEIPLRFPRLRGCLAQAPPRFGDAAAELRLALAAAGPAAARAATLCDA